MLYKYILLKSSWGIVVFFDMEELSNPILNDLDTEIIPGIFLRVNESKKKLNIETIIFWVGKAIKDLAHLIYDKILGTPICLVINSIDFNYTDFQEEGLYCAAQEWIAKYYNIEVPAVKVSFSKEKNRYIFNI